MGCSGSRNQVIDRQFSDDFTTGSVLGRGHFATVYNCTNRETGEKLAVKVIDKKKLSHGQSMRDEVEILKRVSKHPHIVALRAVYEEKRKCYLVMDLCSGGDLFSRLVDGGNYSESSACKVLLQLASALKHMHENGITHRDLKPENVLLVIADPNSDIKVADFGLSKIIGNDNKLMKTVCGTWAYCAPEVIEQKPYTSKVDNWTVGILMYILLSGYHPFDEYGDLAESELLEKITSLDYNFDDPVWKKVSIEAQDAIRNLLKINPKERLSLSDFMSHPWITSARSHYEPLPVTIERLQSFSEFRKRNSVMSKKSSRLSRSESNAQAVSEKFDTNQAKELDAFKEEDDLGEV